MQDSEDSELTNSQCTAFVKKERQLGMIVGKLFLEL